LSGVQADLAVAQAIHESAWGAKPSGKNNFHGIKGKGTEVATHEVEGGVSVARKSSFRNFASMTDSFRAWANVVGRKWSKALSAPTLVDALKALRPGKPGGYATDPNYVSKVAAIGNRVANVGPGPWGAAELAPGYAANLAQQYSAAGNRRAYEQGFRPAPTATPISAFSPQQGPPISAMQRPQQGPPMSAMQSPTISNMLSGMDNPVYGPGQIAPAGRPQQGPPAPSQVSAPKQARVGPAPSVAPARTPSPDMRYGGPQTNVVANTPMQGINMANASLLGPVLGGATLTPGMVGVAMKPAAAPRSVTPTPTPRPDYNAPTAQTPAPAPAAVATAAPATVSAYPDEARFSMKKGLTPAEKDLMGLTQPPAPAFTKPATEVPAQKVAAVKPVREQVVKTRTVAPAPAIAPAAPPPPSGFFAALKNAVAPVTNQITAPFHTLANLAGPVPNPPSRNIGTGLAAISGVLSGQAQAGDTAYSRSMPGFSVKDLGNGMVQKTNQFGHVSFEKVDKPGGGILGGQPTAGGLLSNFGMPGLGGFFSGLNPANAATNAAASSAPASGGLFGAGGLFGGFGGGGTSSASSSGKSSSGKSSGGKSSGGGTTGQSHSTRL
jgi:hypothetical protein